MRPYDDTGVSLGARMRVIDGGRVRLPPRTRLLERLIEETGGASGLRRLTVVSAPTGYGKTRTVAAWLGDGSDAADGVRWVICAHSPAGAPDGSAANGLWSSLARELGLHTRSAVQPGAEPVDETMRLAGLLTEPLTLIVDDYHHATTAENDLALADLSAISPHLTLVIVTRRVTLLDRTLVTARTRVRLIGAEDLALTLDEAHQLAASLGIPPTERLNAALEQADGWPLAVLAALNLGSDALYLASPDAQTWNTSPDAPVFDPIANLDSFARDSLELTGPPARRVILAAARLDAISLRQIQSLLQADFDEALACVRELLELSLLVETPGLDGFDYRSHRSVKAPLCAFATRSTDFAQQASLFRGRAADIERSAPLTAFRLYCAAEDFASAEILLARNFTLITDEAETCAQLLRLLPEEVLAKHPTLTAGLLFLEIPQTSVAPSTIDYLVSLWRQGLRLQLPQGISTPPGPIHLPLLCQAMVVTRITGQLDISESLMRHLESRLAPSYLAEQPAGQIEQIPLRTVATLSGSLPTYYREAAATALMVGDFASARRNLERLQHHSERMIAKPWHGFPYASTRTVTDTESGSRWLLTALGELAFAELLDGDMRRCAELLAEMDGRAAQSGSVAPGISWTGGEIARAHLSYELNDPSLLEQAAARLAPLGDRLEAWQLLLIAETAATRSARGPEVALAHLQSAIARIGQAPAPSRWTESLSGFEAMLCTSIGNFQRAEQILDRAESDTALFRLERARLALFSDENVEALLLAQGVGDPEATKRQQVDRCLIGAVAAWGCGRMDDAFFGLEKAAKMLDAYGLPSMLMSVPHGELREVAVAARDAGVCDLVALVDAVPPHTRPRKYGRLTEMELRTLHAIGEHRTASRAASALFVTTGTVKKHLAGVYRKLGVNGRDEALLTAGRMGLLDSHDAQ